MFVVGADCGSSTLCDERGLRGSGRRRASCEASNKLGARVLIDGTWYYLVLSLE